MSKKICGFDDSSSKFRRTVARTGKWRGIKATLSDENKDTLGKFIRLKFHKLRHQPVILHFPEDKHNHIIFNDTGYSAFNAYLVKPAKGFFKYQPKNKTTESCFISSIGF